MSFASHAKFVMFASELNLHYKGCIVNVNYCNVTVL